MRPLTNPNLIIWKHDHFQLSHGYVIPCEVGNTRPVQRSDNSTLVQDVSKHSSIIRKKKERNLVIQPNETNSINASNNRKRERISQLAR